MMDLMFLDGQLGLSVAIFGKIFITKSDFIESVTDIDLMLGLSWTKDLQINDITTCKARGKLNIYIWDFIIGCEIQENNWYGSRDEGSSMKTKYLMYPFIYCC